MADSTKSIKKAEKFIEELFYDESSKAIWEEVISKSKGKLNSQWKFNNKSSRKLSKNICGPALWSKDRQEKGGKITLENASRYAKKEWENVCNKKKHFESDGKMQFESENELLYKAIVEIKDHRNKYFLDNDICHFIQYCVFMSDHQIFNNHNYPSNVNNVNELKLIYMVRGNFAKGVLSFINLVAEEWEQCKTTNNISAKFFATCNASVSVKDKATYLKGPGLDHFYKEIYQNNKSEHDINEIIYPSYYKPKDAYYLPTFQYMFDENLDFLECILSIAKNRLLLITYDSKDFPEGGDTENDCVGTIKWHEYNKYDVPIISLDKSNNKSVLNSMFYKEIQQNCNKNGMCSQNIVECQAIWPD